MTRFLKPVDQQQEFKDKIPEIYGPKADEVLHTEQKSIMLVYLDGCGWCEKFKPTYVKLYKLIEKHNAKNKNDPIGIYRVDGRNNENQDFLQKYGIMGFPTIYLRGKKSSFILWNGDRDENVLFDSLKKMK